MRWIMFIPPLVMIIILILLVRNGIEIAKRKNRKKRGFQDLCKSPKKKRRKF